WLQAHAEPTLTSAMVAVSWLHSTPAVWIATITLCGFFLWKRKLPWALLTVLVLPGGTLFNYGLKHLFQRARPADGVYVQALHSYSFPSGHTTFATLLYGLITLYLASVLPSLAGRVSMFFVAMGCIVTVAFSRLYLGVHFLSDVLAAFCVGVFWLAVWAILIVRR
ncbi:MAG: phosphatase PAP2 family protein, partial [Burkholderiales bacterium]